MAHYSHQFLAEQLLQFRTIPVYARYNFSASHTKYTSTKEKYRTPQEYTQNNRSASHIKYTSTKEPPNSHSLQGLWLVWLVACDLLATFTCLMDTKIGLSRPNYLVWIARKVLLLSLLFRTYQPLQLPQRNQCTQ